jgi:anti-sigma factor RsiW
VRRKSIGQSSNLKKKAMNCHTCQSKLFDFADGTAATKDYQLMAGHIETCGQCQELLAKVQALNGAIDNERQLVPSSFMAGRIMQRVLDGDAIAHKSKLVLFDWRNLVAAATVAVCIWAGFATGSRYSTASSATSADEMAWMDDNSIELIDAIYNE